MSSMSELIGPISQASRAYSNVSGDGERSWLEGGIGAGIGAGLGFLLSGFNPAGAAVGAAIGGSGGMGWLDFLARPVRTALHTGDVGQAWDSIWDRDAAASTADIVKDLFGTVEPFNQGEGFDIGDVGDFLTHTVVGMGTDPLTFVNTASLSKLGGATRNLGTSTLSKLNIAQRNAKLSAMKAGITAAEELDEVGARAAAKVAIEHNQLAAKMELQHNLPQGSITRLPDIEERLARHYAETANYIEDADAAAWDAFTGMSEAVSKAKERGILADGLAEIQDSLSNLGLGKTFAERVASGQQAMLGFGAFWRQTHTPLWTGVDAAKWLGTAGGVADATLRSTALGRRMSDGLVSVHEFIFNPVREDALGELQRIVPNAAIEKLYGVNNRVQKFWDEFHTLGLDVDQARALLDHSNYATIKNSDSAAEISASARAVLEKLPAEKRDLALKLSADHRAIQADVLKIKEQYGVETGDLRGNIENNLKEWIDKKAAAEAEVIQLRGVQDANRLMQDEILSGVMEHQGLKNAEAQAAHEDLIKKIKSNNLYVKQYNRLTHNMPAEEREMLHIWATVWAKANKREVSDFYGEVAPRVTRDDIHELLRARRGYGGILTEGEKLERGKVPTKLAPGHVDQLNAQGLLSWGLDQRDAFWNFALKHEGEGWTLPNGDSVDQLLKTYRNSPEFANQLLEKHGTEDLVIRVKHQELGRGVGGKMEAAKAEPVGPSKSERGGLWFLNEVEQDRLADVITKTRFEGLGDTKIGLSKNEAAIISFIEEHKNPTRDQVYDFLRRHGKLAEEEGIDVSKIDAFEMQDWEDLVETVRSTMGSLQRKRQADIEKFLTKEFPTVAWDAHKVEEVMRAFSSGRTLDAKIEKVTGQGGRTINVVTLRPPKGFQVDDVGQVHIPAALGGGSNPKPVPWREALQKGDDGPLIERINSIPFRKSNKEGIRRGRVEHFMLETGENMTREAAEIQVRTQILDDVKYLEERYEKGGIAGVVGALDNLGGGSARIGKSGADVAGSTAYRLDALAHVYGIDLKAKAMGSNKIKRRIAEYFEGTYQRHGVAGVEEKIAALKGMGYTPDQIKGMKEADVDRILAKASDTSGPTDTPLGQRSLNGGPKASKSDATQTTSQANPSAPSGTTPTPATSARVPELTQAVRDVLAKGMTKQQKESLDMASRYYLDATLPKVQEHVIERPYMQLDQEMPQEAQRMVEREGKGPFWGDSEVPYDQRPVRTVEQTVVTRTPGRDIEADAYMDGLVDRVHGDLRQQFDQIVSPTAKAGPRPKWINEPAPPKMVKIGAKWERQGFTKSPEQMTSEEWFAYVEKRAQKIGTADQLDVAQIRQVHVKQIKRAITNGEYVNPRVLESYPEIREFAVDGPMAQLNQKNVRRLAKEEVLSIKDAFQLRRLSQRNANAEAKIGGQTAVIEIAQHQIDFWQKIYDETPEYMQCYLTAEAALDLVGRADVMSTLQKNHSAIQRKFSQQGRPLTPNEVNEVLKQEGNAGRLMATAGKLPEGGVSLWDIVSAIKQEPEFLKGAAKRLLPQGATEEQIAQKAAELGKMPYKQRLQMVSRSYAKFFEENPAIILEASLQTAARQITNQARVDALRNLFARRIPKSAEILGEAELNFRVQRNNQLRADMEAAQAAGNHGLVKKLREQLLDVEAAALPGASEDGIRWVRAGGLDKSLEGYMVKEDVFRAMAQQIEREKNPLFHATVFRGMAKLTGWFKKLQLSFPGTWVRDVIGALCVRSQHDGFHTETLTPGNIEGLWRVLLSNGDTDKLAKTTITLGADGFKKSMPGKEFYDLALAHGIFGNDEVTVEVSKMLDAAATGGRRGRPGMLGKVWNTYSEKIPTFFRNQQRLDMFHARLSAGDLPETAAAAVDRALYNYNNVSQTVDMLRRTGVVPFATWASKNIPAQLDLLIHHPGQFAALLHARDALQNGVEGVGEDDLPTYLKNKFNVVFGKDAEGRVWFRTLSQVVPAADLPDATTADFWAQLLGPVIKAPLEQLVNRDMFTGKDISRYDGQLGVLNVMGAEVPMNVRAKQFLKTTIGRPVTLMDQLGEVASGETTGVGRSRGFFEYGGLVSGLVGVSPQVSDPRLNALNRRAEQGREVRAAYAEAARWRKRGRPDLAEAAFQRAKELEK